MKTSSVSPLLRRSNALRTSCVVMGGTSLPKTRPGGGPIDVREARRREGTRGNHGRCRFSVVPLRENHLKSHFGLDNLPQTIDRVVGDISEAVSVAPARHEELDVAHMASAAAAMLINGYKHWLTRRDCSRLLRMTPRRESAVS